MKSALYLATTTRAYRGALDQLQAGGPVDWELWAGELEKISHRDYGTGNLEAPAGWDSVDLSSEEAQTEWELAGEVLAVDRERDRFALLLKNRLFEGEALEVLGFGPALQTRRAQGLCDLLGQPQAKAQPGQAVWIPGAAGIEPLMVARRRHKTLG